FLEFDVHLAADGVPVVIHDHELMRTAGLPGTVFDFNSADLARVEVAERARFGDRYAGVCMPLLRDLVEALANRVEVTVFAEIKRASLRRFGHELVLARVLEALRPIRSRAVVISFDFAAVHMARQQ